MKRVEKQKDKVYHIDRNSETGGSLFKRKNLRVSLKLAEWIETSSRELGVTQSAFMTLKLNEQMNASGFLSAFEKMIKLEDEKDIQRAKELLKEVEQKNA